MLEITSVSNNLVKETTKLQQKKFRKQSGLFLLEGYKPIFEAILSNVQIEKIFVTQHHFEKFSKLIKDSGKMVLVNDAIIEKISTTDTPPEAVAVATQLEYSLSQLSSCKKIALLENIKDAGNLGTIIRSAVAFGIDGIVLCGDTIDIFNPKVVRSAVGALFKVPVVKSELKDVKEIFSQHNFVATVVNHKDIVTPDKIDYSKPTVIMLGSEADGLTDEAISLANTKTTIPMTKNIESLNLSIAASILFYIASTKQ